MSNHLDLTITPAASQADYGLTITTTMDVFNFSIDENINAGDERKLLLATITFAEGVTISDNYSELEGYSELGGEHENDYEITANSDGSYGLFYDGSGYDYETSSDRQFSLDLFFDFETSAGGFIDEKWTLNVTVNNVDEPLEFVDPPTVLHVFENAEEGDLLATLKAIDPDSASGRIRYKLADDVAGYFEVTRSGRLKVRDDNVLDYETNQSHAVDVTAFLSGRGVDRSDPVNMVTTRITVNVIDVIEDDDIFQLAELNQGDKLASAGLNVSAAKNADNVRYRVLEGTSRTGRESDDFRINSNGDLFIDAEDGTSFYARSQSITLTLIAEKITPDTTNALAQREVTFETNDIRIIPVIYGVYAVGQTGIIHSNIILPRDVDGDVLRYTRIENYDARKLEISLVESGVNSYIRVTPLAESALLNPHSFDVVYEDGRGGVGRQTYHVIADNFVPEYDEDASNTVTTIADADADTPSVSDATRVVFNDQHANGAKAIVMAENIAGTASSAFTVGTPQIVEGQYGYLLGYYRVYVDSDADISGYALYWQYQKYQSFDFADGVSSRTDQFSVKARTALGEESEVVHIRATLDKSDTAIHKITTHNIDTTFNNALATEKTIIIGSPGRDIITASRHGDTIIGGTGPDIITLNSATGARETIVYHIDVTDASNPVAHDGSTTINNFRRHEDILKLVLMKDEVTELTHTSLPNDTIIQMILDTTLPPAQVVGIHIDFASSGTIFGAIPAGNRLTINFAETIPFGPLEGLDFTDIIGGRQNIDITTGILRNSASPLTKLFGGRYTDGTENLLLVNQYMLTNNNPTGTVRITKNVDGTETSFRSIYADDIIQIDMSGIRDADNIAPTNTQGTINTEQITYLWLKFDTSAQMIKDIAYGTGDDASRYTIKADDTGDFLRVISSYTDILGNVNYADSYLGRVSEPRQMTQAVPAAQQN